MIGEELFETPDVTSYDSHAGIDVSDVNSARYLDLEILHDKYTRINVNFSVPSARICHWVNVIE